MEIVDISKMPNFNPVVKDNVASVSEGRVIMHPIFHQTGDISWNDAGPMRPHPACMEHGCMNQVSGGDAAGGAIWRCLECGAGCYALQEK